MLLTCAGPPLHLSLDEALTRRTLPELLAVYLRTRQWQRDQAADELERRALQIRLAGVGDDGRRYARDLEWQARQLRRPEAAPELPELDAETLRVLNPYAVQPEPGTG